MSHPKRTATCKRIKILSGIYPACLLCLGALNIFPYIAIMCLLVSLSPPSVQPEEANTAKGRTNQAPPLSLSPLFHVIVMVFLRDCRLLLEHRETSELDSGPPTRLVWFLPFISFFFSLPLPCHYRPYHLHYPRPRHCELH